MKWFVRSLCGLLLLLFSISSVHAQSAFEVPDYTERIDSYVSDIQVSKDSTATITETIKYNFGAYPRHGIKRYVPIKTKDSDGKGHYYYEVKLLSVSADGKDVEVKKQRQGSYLYLRIGDPNRTITGQHEYKITYTIGPVMEQGKDGAGFGWDVIGDGWDVPIKSAQSTIRYPDGANVTSVLCYTGQIGSTEKNCTVNASENTVNFKLDSELPAKAGATVYVVVKDFAFSNYLTLNNRPASEYYPLFGYLVGIGAIILGILRRTKASIAQNSAKKNQTIIAQYDAPDGLSPGDVGHLIDNESSMVEITATLIDLARRGHLKIEQTRPKSTFKKAEYTFYKLAGKSKLQTYEKDLLDAIFAGKSKMELKSVSKTKVPTAISKAKAAFKQNLEAKDYYLKESPAKNKSKFLVRLGLFSFALVAALNILAIVAGMGGAYIVWSFITAFLGLTLGAAIAHKVRYSDSGYKEWAKVEGLKLFLSVTEKDRMAFHNAPKKTPNLFNKLLPYAIALGVEKEWAKQFEGMDLEEATSWYGSPTHNFSAYYLASSLSSDFSSSVASNFSPPSQSSSSGGGGGGFSGGGGGGGGGGSW